MKTKVYKSEIMDVAEKGIVTIAISKFDNTDSMGDVVRKGAFAKTFLEGGNRIKHVIDHQLRAAAVVGLPIKMYETSTHAVVESALNLEKQISRDLFSDYKFFQSNGKTLEHSYGYKTLQAGKSATPGGGEEILELKMFEYSTVAMGANSETPLLSIKSLTQDDIPALEEFLRKFDVTNAKGKQIESIIKQIKELKEPVTATPDAEPEIPLAKKLNEILNTKKIFQ